MYGAYRAAGPTYVQSRKDLEPKRRRGACRDSVSRTRQPRRFANSDLNSFAPVLGPVSAPPACEAAA